MNRIKKLLLVVLLSSMAGVTSFAQSINKTDVKSIMKRVADWQIANPNKDAEHDDLDWTHAALYMGMVTGPTSQKGKTATALIISGCFALGNAIIFKLESGCIMLILLP